MEVRLEATGWRAGGYRLEATGWRLEGAWRWPLAASQCPVGGAAQCEAASGSPQIPPACSL